MLKLTKDEVQRIAQLHEARPLCPSCAVFASDGWESFPSTASESVLLKMGALCAPGDDEPTLNEHHPQGTDYWSASAPIALDFHPYNRCELWCCMACSHPFLRYTEYGGYYEDRRIRNLNPTLIVV